MALSKLLDFSMLQVSLSANEINDLPSQYGYGDLGNKMQGLAHSKNQLAFAEL